MHPAAVERDFRERAERLRAWGAGLLVVAGLLWVYAAWQVFVPYTSSWGKVDCSAPAFADRDELYGDFDTDARDRAERCAADRDWPGPVTALVLAVPLSGVGAVLFATGAVSLRMRDYEDARLRAER